MKDIFLLNIILCVKKTISPDMQAVFTYSWNKSGICTLTTFDVFYENAVLL